MSSLPPSSTPPAGDESTPVSLHAADAASEASPAAAAPTEPTPAADDAGAPAVDAAVQPADAATAAEAPAAEQTTDAVAKPAQEDCGPQLKKLYPALFSNPPKPLKLRIQADIQARSPGMFTKPQLSAFLRRYTGSHAYLNALVKATHRFDLDGNAGDELSDEHRNAASEELARRRANTQARIALEMEQRANRATLLKEFEANTLPVAEFAAAKGVPEGELEPLIARARKEALEPPPAPAFNRDRRGPAPQHKRGPRPPGQRDARPPRDANAAKAQPAADGAAPQTDAPRAPRPPRDDATRGPRAPRSDAPRGDRPQGARADAPRSDRPKGPLDAPRADRPRGPLDAPRGPRPDASRNGLRPDGRGPRADGPRGPNNGPRSDAPRGPRRDDDRRPPRPDDARGPRPNVVSTPAAPTAMALAFSALSALKTKK